MNFKEYQQLTSTNHIRKGVGFKDSLINATFGLLGESAECSELIKKFLYQGHGLDKQKLILELGDTLNYLTFICNIFSIELEEVANENIEKLKKRYPNGFCFEDSRNRIEDWED